MRMSRPFSNINLGAAMVIAVGVVLRCWHIGDLSLNHFDEGVLVSGAFGVWLKGPWHFPLAQPLQAPPLFPWMVAATFSLTQTASPMMAIYLSAFLGSATIVVYFALLRRLYGGRFALVGSALLAASDLHIAFSRMAMTDVALTFWFVVGAYFLTRFVQTTGAGREGRCWSGAMCGWTLALGLAVGAAWNTKYNGWMLIAIAATAWFVLLLRRSIMRRRWGADGVAGAMKNPFSPLSVLLAIGVAGLICVACFMPWYWHVEQTFMGGYSAVTANHWRYFGGIAEWPSRAGRLWLSLTAFRHLGWATTLLAGSAALVCETKRGLVATPLIGLAVTFVLGSDAVLAVIAAVAIVPALIWGRWPEVLFSVWTGAFFVMTPFYHPYTRLLVPALPAVIALVVWMLAEASRQGIRAEASPARAPDQAPRALRRLLTVASICLIAAALVWHPFGWLPAPGTWSRWSSRQSYRALGDAVSQAGLPKDAVILCQGPPAMTLYLDREWAPLELVPFHLWLPRVDPTLDCYFAVDSWGLYSDNHQLALDSFLTHLECLEPVAQVPNDLNLPTLLDYLPAAEVARHLSANWPPKQIADAHGRKLLVPAPLDERSADLIVLYRIDRNCVSLLDRMADGALK